MAGALDLCLACKGCTSECPAGVDLPSYKAEFLHRHYQGRLRPRHAYAFGLIDQVARVDLVHANLSGGLRQRVMSYALVEESRMKATRY